MKTTSMIDISKKLDNYKLQKSIVNEGQLTPTTKGSHFGPFKHF